VVLNTLGAEDYGIYNVIVSFVAMFGFLSGSMVSGSQRFFAVEIGRENQKRLQQTFSITVSIYIGMAILIILLSETIGLWFLNTKMNIPAERIDAANWVYQASIFSFILKVITIPYSAIIMAHEKMSFYAYISIIETGLSLTIVYILIYFSFDKLKLYAILTASVSFTILFINRIYCKRKFKECLWVFYWEKDLAFSLLSYSGFNVIGYIAGLTKNHGINILLNVFGGTVINAARGIAFQIHSAISLFITNLYAASRPQITKYYAVNDVQAMWRLVFITTRISYYLLLIMAIPALLEIEYILSLWLKNVPEYTSLFTRLIIIGLMIEVMTNPLVIVLQAANKIKYYQIAASISFLNVPISYILLHYNYPTFTPFIVSIILTIVYVIIQMIITKREVNLSILAYFKEIILPLIMVTLFSFVIPYFIRLNINSGIIRFVLVSIVGWILFGLCIWIIDLNTIEKKWIIAYIKRRIR
jgi:O-antigen/teichoic acid export membrane protein